MPGREREGGGLKRSRELAEGGPDIKRWWVVAGGLRPRKRK